MGIHRKLGAPIGKLFLLGASVFTFAACTGAAPDDPAAATSEPFSTTPQEPNHEAITADGLAFLRPEIITALQAADVSVDVEYHFVAANHFDNCNFSEGAKVIAEKQAAAVAALDPSSPPPATDAAALFSFGQAIHTAQDFYAHSNWVESGETTLLNADLTPWPTLTGYEILAPSEVLVVEGPQRPFVHLSPEGTTYPERAVIRFRDRGARGLALMSGVVDYEPNNQCPASISMTHADLNKDQSTNLGRGTQFVTARGLAVRQTRHEWCRLEAMTRAKWGGAGTARLSAWLADPSAPPACP